MPVSLSQLEQTASRFMAAYFHGDEPDLAIIDQLSSEALAGDSAALALLYSVIVEGLCDDFTSRGVALANRVLLRIIACLRRSETGKELHRWLDRHCADEQALLTRYDRLCREPVQVAAPRKIILLSRVSIGADVMITSIVLQRLRKKWPHCPIVVLGPGHLPQLFAKIDGVSFRILPYSRFGGLEERVLKNSLTVRDMVDEECQGYGADEVLLFDPDSRLSQLGLLPFMEEGQTRYFPSRSSSSGKGQASLVALTNHWLDDCCAEQAFCYPALFLDQRLLARARHCVREIGKGGTRVVVVNYGVGHNPRKRLGEDFERQIVLRLLADRPTMVVLDSGSSPAGRRRVAALLGQLHDQGVNCTFLSETELGAITPEFAHGVMGFQGSIGAIAALIAKADCFLGYDSCCQHLANATGTPGVVVFAGAPNSRFLQRWRPENAVDSVAVVAVPDTGEKNLQDLGNLVEEVAMTVNLQLAE